MAHETGAQIIVAQTHQYALDWLRNKTCRESPNKIEYTTNPGQVLAEACINPIDIVITGQLFYKTDLVTLPEKIQALQTAMTGRIKEINEVMSHYVRPKYAPETGTELSEELYKINPDTLVIRFSFSSGDIGRIVGDIEKDTRGFSTLAKFLGSPELSDILKTKDWKRFRNQFPDIRFYDTLESQH